MPTQNQLDAAARRAAVASGKATLLTVREALALAPVKRTTLYLSIKSGALPSHLLGGKRVIARDALERWMHGKYEPVAAQAACGGRTAA